MHKNMIEKEVSCDSKCILSAIKRVSKSLYTKVYWVKDVIYIMDNTGEYMNINIIHKYTYI